MRTLLFALTLTGCGTLDAVHEDDLLLSGSGGTKAVLAHDATAPGLFADGPRLDERDPATDVWTVHRAWGDLDAEPGMAWGADSGLTWNEKYAAWIHGLEVVDMPDDEYVGASDELLLLTPLGQRVRMPAVYESELPILLRTLFASWYGLPFFMTAEHPEHGRVHFGHFGVVSDTGAPIPGFAAYRDDYEDHSALGVGALDAWPSDVRLARRQLDVGGNDEVPWMESNKFMGAYLDIVLLNKRVGHFIQDLLPRFGPENLAYSTNLFDVEFEDLRAGDVAAHRRRATVGTGDAFLITQVRELDEGMSVQFALTWDERSIPDVSLLGEFDAILKLTSDGAGSTRMFGDQHYAEFGGGVKRWRNAELLDGQWVNLVPWEDRNVTVDSTDWDDLGRRVYLAENLLVVPEVE